MDPNSGFLFHNVDDEYQFVSTKKLTELVLDHKEVKILIADKKKQKGEVICLHAKNFRIDFKKIIFNM